ncbi:hypothetical protein CRUP_028790 [Coryphaenoides rupestris]|nr:hypothetical protein CRUP_028790 [Coryphaenoides rupestris]
MADIIDFETAESGASNTYPHYQCSALPQEWTCGHEGTSLQIVNLVGIDIFTNKKYEDVCPSTHNMDLINITDGFMSLMFENGDIREDLRLPEGDLGKEIQSKFDANDEFLSGMASVVTPDH